ncbi:MAG: hypothetical protein KDE45_24745, partial [Caldilineaceae bacterium]|nr:hypothetical protein [Caldilineaceae bacterium]
LRGPAYREPIHENTVLDAAALGMAALADGDTFEADQALMRAYQLLESGNLNDDNRLFAAAVINEGISVYKGEPFEQAMTYHALAVTAALEGDWENVRIASRASTRKLREFADARSSDTPTPPEAVAEELAERDTNDDASAFITVDTNFAVAYLLEAIADNAIGRTSNAIALAKAADSRVAPLADDIAAARYNTVVIVHLGMGPVKEPTGPHQESTLWTPREPDDPGPMFTTFNGWDAAPGVRPVTNVARMSRDHRWINFESIRRLKALIGEGLVVGGVIVGAGNERNESNQIASAAMILTGILLQASSAADLRHNSLLPAAVYLAVMDLPEQPGTLELRFPERGLPPMAIPNFTPGAVRNPAVVYMRLTGREPARWYTANTILYTNDADPPRAGAIPWILGGRDVSTPTQAVLDAYQAGGVLTDISLSELEELYRLEGIQIGEGPTGPDDRRHASYQHIFDGGSALFTPHPFTMGYKRLMCISHISYVPKSARVRELAERIRRNTHSNQEVSP